MEQGWSGQEKSFVQYYGSDALDASALLMVLTKFTSPTDPRMLSTIERIQHKLSSGALVHRYSIKWAEDDGLGPMLRVHLTRVVFGWLRLWLVLVA